MNNEQDLPSQPSGIIPAGVESFPVSRDEKEGFSEEISNNSSISVRRLQEDVVLELLAAGIQSGWPSVILLHERSPSLRL